MTPHRVILSCLPTPGTRRPSCDLSCTPLQHCKSLLTGSLVRTTMKVALGQKRGLDRTKVVLTYSSLHTPNVLLHNQSTGLVIRGHLLIAIQWIDRNLLKGTVISTVSKVTGHDFIHAEAFSLIMRTRRAATCLSHLLRSIPIDIIATLVPRVLEYNVLPVLPEVLAMDRPDNWQVSKCYLGVFVVRLGTKTQTSRSRRLTF
ncbi:hypothetical protein EDD16DRAFT_1198554 [Pisolithus croceorrhizus]|nr:hypothetical protein EDD16DRAFT_1198554 [Pisolithus croceorrhizus]KAI6132946.1 hypothetical protein EV401DRAFT_163935 [Pisolithus croceorrhizus]KAI6144881.1 hypothetical protein EDD17DRAFT_1709709 [Pisolithus thermaeus]